MNVGVTAQLYRKQANSFSPMGEKLMYAVMKDVRHNRPVFVDSGAFGVGMAMLEYRTGKIDFKPKKMNWKNVFRVYTKLSLGFGGRDKSFQWYPPNERPFFFVAPDIVGDAPGTLELIKEWRKEIIELKKYSTQNFFIVALHSSPTLSMVEFDRQVTKILGYDDWIRGYPMVNGVTKLSDFIEHIETIKPRKIHLLGLSYLGDNYRPFIEAIFCHVPDAQISMDTARIQALAGKAGKGKKERVLTTMRNLVTRELDESNFIEEYIKNAMKRMKEYGAWIFAEESGDGYGPYNDALINGITELTNERSDYREQGLHILPKSMHKDLIEYIDKHHQLYDSKATPKIQKQQRKNFLRLMKQDLEDGLFEYSSFLEELQQFSNGKPAPKLEESDEYVDYWTGDQLFNQDKIIDDLWDSWYTQIWEDKIEKLAKAEYHRRKSVGSLDRVSKEDLGQLAWKYL